MIIVTTIRHPTKAVRAMSNVGGWELVIVGDRQTPDDWELPGAAFLSLNDQASLFGSLASLCPVGHYARKNFGYLYAIAQGASVIAETDDDNLPYPTFPGHGSRWVNGRRISAKGWQNVYRCFTDEPVWPRGFPLERVRDSLCEVAGDEVLGDYECSIQQYLADGDPDVDAIYRLTVGREHTFRGHPVILREGAFCPFNSQNTVWWPDAYPLLYLPAYASFRMTDIWRSFVAQACLYAAGGSLAFMESTVYQERNPHMLLRDFELEVPGYLHNGEIMDLLRGLRLSKAASDITGNLRLCYEELVAGGFLPATELRLIDAWVEALALVRVCE